MKSHNYEEFVEKFKPKLTTDDCYTPPTIYDIVADGAAVQAWGRLQGGAIRHDGRCCR